jgi:hypothetical protein
MAGTVASVLCTPGAKNVGDLKMRSSHARWRRSRLRLRRRYDVLARFTERQPLERAFDLEQGFARDVAVPCRRLELFMA